MIDATRGVEFEDDYPPVAEISPELKQRTLEEFPELFEDFTPA